jgi:hypothetical protein
VPEYPASWIKDACALRRLGHPRNIPIKQGYRLSLQKASTNRARNTLNRAGLLQWAEFHMGLRVGRGRETGRPRRRPSSCGVLDEGWKLSVASPPLVRRDWRRHRAKGSVFAFAPTVFVRLSSWLPPFTLVTPRHRPFYHVVVSRGE